MPKLTGLDHLVLTVRDMSATIKFYRDVLGMGVERFQAADETVRTALKFGRYKINLHQAGAEFEPKARSPVPGSADICFVTETALADWQAKLDRLGVATTLGPVHRTGANGKIVSIYLRDPDGNLLEIGRYV